MKKGSSNCRIHGYTEDVIKKSRGSFACKRCEYRRHKEWRQKEENRLKVIRWAQRYQALNPEKVEEFKLKNQLRNLKSKEKRILEKIEHPSVDCARHGFVRDVLYYYKKTKMGGPIYRCRLCHNECQRKYMRRKNENEFTGSGP